MFENYTTAEARIKDEFGMHARPSMLIAKKCQNYDKQVCITKEGSSEKYNCKQATSVMMMDAQHATLLKIHVEGMDERARTVCRDIVNVITSDIDTIDEELRRERDKEDLARLGGNSYF